MIIWSFKGVDTKFRSTPAKHDRDIFKMANACGVAPETEIIYHHGKPNRDTIENTFAVNGDTDTKEQQTVQAKPKARKPRSKKTTGLSNVPSDVDSTNYVLDRLESGWGTSGTSGSGDGLDD